jgi:P63C domain
MTRHPLLEVTTVAENESEEPKKATVNEAGAKGGKARAEKLSPKRRREIGKAAAVARWAKEKGSEAGGSIPRATHGGVMQVGDIAIPCYVLETGIRVISHRGLQKSLGLAVKGSATKTAHFMGQFELKVPDGKDLTARLSNPIRFTPPFGRSGFGYEATVLADICEVVLAARQAGVTVGRNADRLAVQCEILLRGFARVGIIALVDEATGYQYDRARDELHRILEQYVSKELARWEKTFDADFYKHMHRLKGWTFDPSGKRSHAVARLTVDLTYDRIHPDLLAELKQVRDEKERRGQKLHQWLTTGDQGGHPRLKQHLEGIGALMEVARDWNEFKYWIDRRYPKHNETMCIPFPEPEEEDAPVKPAEG